jgi:hypothetical protein
MSQTLSLTIQNAGGGTRIVIIEPWGRDFALGVDEKLEVTARPGPDGAAIRVVEADHRTLIYAPGCFEVCVIQDGVTHNLALEEIVGTAFPQILPSHGVLDPMWDRHLDG